MYEQGKFYINGIIANFAFLIINEKIQKFILIFLSYGIYNNDTTTTQPPYCGAQAATARPHSCAGKCI